MKLAPAFAGALFLTTILGACGIGPSLESGQVVAKGGVDFSAGFKVKNVAPGEINSMNITGLCVEGGDEGTVTSVEAAPDSGVAVREFTVLDETDIGGTRRSFEELGIEVEHDVASGCDEEGSGPQLLVELYLPNSRSAYTPYLEVESEIDGKTESFRYPLGLTLCVLGDSAKVCTADEARAGHLGD